ncbi:hypothetical protein ACFYOT_33415 [Saccharothrix saharensis]|uniref:hypothetical protein n=1 Tax=Saccharothrix saharensis TaxID=571190 RepID=UPI0036B3224A
MQVFRANAGLSMRGGREGSDGEANGNLRGSYRMVDLPPTVLAESPAITTSTWVQPEHATMWARVFDFGDDVSRSGGSEENSSAPRATDRPGSPLRSVITSRLADRERVDGVR